MTLPAQIDVVTLFPDMVTQAAGYGVTGRAKERGLWQLRVWNPRDFATDTHRTVDDRPYGGGPGMVMMPGPLAAAIGAARLAQMALGIGATRVLYLTPAGRPLTHAAVVELASAALGIGSAVDAPVGISVQVAGNSAGESSAGEVAHEHGGTQVGYVLLAGRYEGVDERLIEREVDDEIAVGDFVVSGGELPALMLIDALARLLPGALNDEQSAQEDSFANGLLDCPHYTRPERYENAVVPPVLMSGDHSAIRRWRFKEALGRTWQRRPDLLALRKLTHQEASVLAAYRRDRDVATASAQADGRTAAAATGDVSTNDAHQGKPCSARAATGQRNDVS